MGIEEAIKKLEKSNRGLNMILESIDETLGDLRNDPRIEGLVDDLESLFYSYLKIWIKTNTEVLDILREKHRP